MSREFANGLEDWSSIPGRVIPKTRKMVLDAALLNTLHYKVWIKGKVEQSREWSSAPRLRETTLLLLIFFTYISWGVLRGVLAKVLDCNIEVSNFDLQSHSYVYFRVNSL